MEQSVQPRPKSRVSTWNEFEKELIEFVKETPVIYDPKAKLYNTGETRAETRNRLWVEFAAKWNFSVTSCKSRWILIKGSYIRMKRNRNKKSAAYKKYMDGRLSFLDPLIKRNKKYTDNTLMHDETSLMIRETTADIEMENHFIMGLLEKTDKFTEFEEQLVDLVKDYPVLYDPRISLNIKSKSREKITNGAWKKISSETGVSDPVCQTTWNKISMQYYRVHCMKDKYEIYYPCFMKFFTDKFNFLRAMYLLIKETTIDVFDEESIEKAIIRSNGIVWSDFQLNLIDFVKEHRIIYDANECNKLLTLQPNYRFTLRQLWIEFGKRFELPNYETAMNQWDNVRRNYLKFIKEIADKNTNFNSLPLCYLRYQKLSFLNEVYSNSTASCNQTNNLNVVNASEEIVNLSGSDDETTLMHEEPITLKTEAETNLYDSLLEVEDNNIFCYENLLSNDEPQPSTSSNEFKFEPETSKNIYFTTPGDPEEFSVANNETKSGDCVQELTSKDNRHLCDLVVEVENNFISQEKLVSNDEPQSLISDERYLVSPCDTEDISAEKYDTESEEYVEESISMENHQSLSTMDFFKEIGKIVMNNFNKKEQKNIRLKSWGLITELKLSMLQEDTDTFD